MTRSVAIIGKGPSVRYSTKAFVDSFDDIAICNFPPMENYQHLISNRATHHFLNAGDSYPYSREFLNNLGLKEIFNTSRHVYAPNQIFLPDHDVSYIENYGIGVKKKYEEKYNFWPSTGIMAFDYFLNHPEYQKISLVGFDFFLPGKDVYYFPKNEVNPSLHRLWNDELYSMDGKVLKESLGHGGERVKEIILSLIQKSDKDILILDKKIV